MKKLMIAITVIFLLVVAWIAFRYVWVSYYNRGSNYMTKGEYDQAWEDVHKAQSMEFQVPPDFLKALREASGREN